MNDNIKLLLKLYDDLNLKCDNMTRCISLALTQENIIHTVMKGSVTHRDTLIDTHFWIETDTHTIDFTLYKTVNDAPKGVFNQSSFPNTIYQGKEYTKLMPMVYRLLSDYDKHLVPRDEI